MRGDFEISVAYFLNPHNIQDYQTFVQFFLPGYVLIRAPNDYQVFPEFLPSPYTTNDIGAKARFVRTGSDISAYVNDILIYTWNNYGTGDLDFKFGPHLNGVSGSLDVIFDNLTIRADSLVDYAPIPGSLLLLGSGLLGLAGWRRFRKG